MELTLLYKLALILFATKIFGLLTRKIHLPQVVGALLAGVIFGPALLGFIEPNEMITMIAEIGVLLLLFEAGLESNLNKLRKSIKSYLLIAIFGVALSLAGGFAIAYIFGRSLIESFFLGVILTSTSVSITVEVLHEMGKLNSKIGAVILNSSVVDDIFTVILLSVAIGMGNGGVSFTQIGMTLLKMVIFFILAVVCGFAAFKAFEYMSARRGMARRLSVFGLAFCFIMAYTAGRFGLATIVGAYIAGLVLCNSKSERYIDAKSNVLSYMFFSPVFFASIGLKMSFDGLDGGMILFAALFIVASITGKFVGCGLGAKLCKYSFRESAQIGAGMVARCEFAMAAAAIGMGIGIVSIELFSVVVIMVIVTAFIAPILLKLLFGKENNKINEH